MTNEKCNSIAQLDFFHNLRCFKMFHKPVLLGTITIKNKKKSVANAPWWPLKGRQVCFWFHFPDMGASSTFYTALIKVRRSIGATLTKKGKSF